MKSIDTLVKDIYDLFDSQTVNTLDDTEIDKYLDKFTKSIKNNIKNVLTEKPRNKKKLTLSSIGKPARQLWYKKNSTKEEELLEPSTKIKFLYGHILEDLLILLSRVAGHTVTEEQKEVYVNDIKGHQDCKIDGKLVDCKSTSTYGFRKFATNRIADDDPFGYIGQISAYSDGNNVDEAYFLAIDKQHGKIALTKVHSLEMINAKERIEYLKKTLDRNTPPERCYKDIPDGVSGNYKLNVGCFFCPHKKECWSDCNNGKGLRLFKYEKGLTYLTKVQKEPRVEEIKEW